MADDFALIRIVKVTPPKNNKPASIDVKGLAANASGDLDVLSTTNGTTVNIVLAKKLVDGGNQNRYSFDTAMPICVSAPGSTQPCKAGEFPTTDWTVSNISTDSLTLNVPALPQGSGGYSSYKYSLFMFQTPKGGTPIPITIDPRITNGGQPFEGSVVKTYDAGLSGLTLLLLAILLLAAGTIFGWALAGGRKGY
jgi:hypothetical protein